MALQVRVRHSLGERVVELPERGVSEPVIVGRGRDAEVQVPSVSVAPRHCVFFVHEGQWIVQGAEGVILLNGEELTEPAVLQVGDVVALGNEHSAPLLEMDPIGAAEGRIGPLVVSTPTPAPAPRRMAPAPAPSRAPTSTRAPAPAPAPAPMRSHSAPPQPAAYAQSEYAPQEEAADGGIESFDWAASSASASADPTAKRPVRKPPQNSQGAMVAVIVVAAVAVIAVIGYVVHRLNNPPKPEVITIGSPSTPKAAPKPTGLFDLAADQAAARAQHQEGADRTPTSAGQSNSNSASDVTPTPAPVPPAPAAPESTGSNPSSAAPAPTGSTADSNPAEQPAADKATANDPDWAAVESAHFDVRHQGLAIVRYDEYRRDHPGKFTAQLDKYVDEAVNWLYWQRVAQLWKKQDELAAQVKQKELDLRTQPPGDFHNQLAKDAADLKTKLDDSKKNLTDEMGYSADIPPDPENLTQLQQLATKRDPDKYAAFRKHVLAYVRNNHGATWWDGE